MEAILPTLKSYLILLSLHSSRYVILAIGSFLLIKKFSTWAEKRQIQNVALKNEDIRRELKYSFSTIILNGLFLVTAFHPSVMPHTRIYTEINERGYAWIVISFILLVFIHDTYFYWMHRLLHHPKIFKHVHRVHHFSTNPTCLASQSFHPIEAFFQVVFTYPVVFILPIHPAVLVTFGGFSFVYNVYGHMNIELLSKGVRSHRLFRWCGTATVHNAHHKQFNGNYGLYFRFWDRLMKTNLEE